MSRVLLVGFALWVAFIGGVLAAGVDARASGCSQRGPEYVWINRASGRRLAPRGVPAGPPASPTATPQPPRGAAPALPYALDLAPGQTARSLTVAQWQALQGAFPERTYTMARMGWCEGGLDPAKAVMDPVDASVPTCGTEAA